MVPTEKNDSNSRTFLDFFSFFSGLFPSKFQDFSRTLNKNSRTFQDFYGVVQIATAKFLFCKIKTYIL